MDKKQLTLNTSNELRNFRAAPSMSCGKDPGALRRGENSSHNGGRFSHSLNEMDINEVKSV